MKKSSIATLARLAKLGEPPAFQSTTAKNRFTGVYHTFEPDIFPAVWFVLNETPAPGPTRAENKSWTALWYACITAVRIEDPTGYYKILD